MRKLAAALLVLAAVPIVAAERPIPRDKTIALIVSMSHAEDIERAAIGAVIDALLAQATTPEQKQQLEQLRGRAMQQDTSETWKIAIDRNFDDKSAAALLECYRSDIGRIIAYTMHDAIGQRLKPAETVDDRNLRNAKQTLADMRALAVAIEARATDTNEYPETADLETLRKLVEPTYIRRMPARDAWGHEFLYIGTPNHNSYRIVSAGADGVFEPQSRQLVQVPPHETDRFEDDLIYQDGEFVQFPRGIIKKEQD